MDKSYFLTLVISVAVISGLFYAAYVLEGRYNLSDYLASSGDNSGGRSNSAEEIKSGGKSGLDSLLNNNTGEATGLKKEDLKVGTGREAKTGDKVSVNYLGTLTNGAKFDSSYDRKEPFEFTLGAGQVIKGWDLGVVGMKVGGKRRLTIPAELGYGNRAVGPIPANSTLIFEVELMGITNSQ